MTFVVGLTGGIGSGKSAAAADFAALGATVVDTDVIAHELTAKGGAYFRVIRGALAYRDGQVLAEPGSGRFVERAFRQPAPGPAVR